MLSQALTWTATFLYERVEIGDFIAGRLQQVYNIFKTSGSLSVIF